MRAPPRSRWQQTEHVWRTALILSMLVVLLLTLLWALQRRLIYFPETDPPPPAAEVLPGARDVLLKTSDGLRLGAWHLPAQRDDPDIAVLVANGNAGDRSLRTPLAQALAARGLSVLLFDYRGYGGNQGSPSEQGLARDVSAARRFLVEHGADRLVYYGESLGAAVVTELATRRPPAGMVLRSPFVDLASVGRAHYPFLPVGLLLRDRFPLVEQVAQVTSPTLVVYGSEDSVVPPEQSRAVAEAVPRLTRAVRVQGADHNDLALLNGDELIGAVEQLVDVIRRAS